MVKLSVIIITKNEEEKIKDCLDSVSWADEIIVVDDYSTDKTVEIVSMYPNAKIFKRKMVDGFGPQNQYALEKATGEWILYVDADERITEKGKEEILHKIAQKEYDAYYSRNKNWVFGKFIYDSGTDKICLFKRNKGRFSNVSVHHRVLVNGKIGVIEEPKIHYSRRLKDITNYIKVSNFYSSLSAKDLYSKGRRVTILTMPVYFFLYPIYIFFRLFILKKHYKDGMAGFLLSLMRSLDGFMNYIKVLELQLKEKQSEKKEK